MNDFNFTPYQIPVVCGPTASGKTTLAVQLCKAINCSPRTGMAEIISADSRQIYKGMDIGTGKDLDEYGEGHNKITHHCIDIAEPEEIFTLYHFQKACYSSIEEIRKNNHIPLICGGTGLYIEAVLKHYQIPDIPENNELRDSLQLFEKEELIKRLQKIDNDLANKSDLTSKKRVIRAIEIAEYAKKQPIQWSSDVYPEIEPIIMITRWPRNELLERIDFRLDERLNKGMVNEVQTLIDKGLSFDRLNLFGMEYGWIGKYLFNQIKYQVMVDSLRKSIHQLSKRQMTWFRGMERRGFSVNWVDKADTDHALSLFNQKNRL